MQHTHVRNDNQPLAFFPVNLGNQNFTCFMETSEFQHHTRARTHTHTQTHHISKDNMKISFPTNGRKCA